MDLADFGITILMLHFAKFYSRGQYPLFVNAFKCVKELEIIETYLLKYNQNHIQLPINMATHSSYGLMAQKHLFVNNNALTCQVFKSINESMRLPSITPSTFIKLIELLHINIIESFYIFTSITKNCKIISECKELTYKCLNYTFVKPYKSTVYDGDYWFVLPQNAIWFAYHMGRVKIAYVSADTRALLHQLDSIKDVVMGFIYDNQLFPIVIENPNLIGNWKETIKVLQKLKLNCILSNCPPVHNAAAKNFYFVRESFQNIFKLIKK